MGPEWDRVVKPHFQPPETLIVKGTKFSPAVSLKSDFGDNTNKEFVLSQEATIMGP